MVFFSNVHTYCKRRVYAPGGTVTVITKPAQQSCNKFVVTLTFKLFWMFGKIFMWNQIYINVSLIKRFGNMHNEALYKDTLKETNCNGRKLIEYKRFSKKSLFSPFRSIAWPTCRHHVSLLVSIWYLFHPRWTGAFFNVVYSAHRYSFSTTLFHIWSYGLKDKIKPSLILTWSAKFLLCSASVISFTYVAPRTQQCLSFLSLKEMSSMRRSMALCVTDY